MQLKQHKSNGVSKRSFKEASGRSNLSYSSLSDNQGMQRRFMWKQMEGTMEGIMNAANTGTQAVKNMIGEFLPLVQTTPNTDFAATTTTRIKYIIKKPTPMKIIKIRTPHKITKIIKMPTTVHQAHKVNYMTDSLNKGNKNNKYHALETAAEALASAKPGKHYELIKPSAMSKLHTNIMLDASGTTLGKVVTAEPTHTEHDYSFAASNKNGYEVVEHIDEEDNIDYNHIILPTILPYGNAIQDTETISESTTTTSSVDTLTNKNKAKLHDSVLLSRVNNTFDLIENSWQPSFGHETSTTVSTIAATHKPKRFWLHDRRTLLSDENVHLETSSSIATILEKSRTKKRSKNISLRQKVTQEKMQQQPQQHEPHKQQHIEIKSKHKRGSIKFGDKIN